MSTPRQSLSIEREPTVQTTRWPSPIRDERWRARGRVQGDDLPEAWATVFGKVPWATFWTLTFDAERRFGAKGRYGVGQELASREAFAWANQSARVQHKPVGWVYGTERGRNGLWHVHALTTAAPSRVNDYLTLDWQLRNGHVHSRLVTDLRSAVLYTSKEAALTGEMVFSDTMVGFSNKLNASTVVELWPDER